jgi:hypothetical protein
MHLTHRETWAAIHGMIVGAIFLVAFTGGLAGLWSLRPALLTQEGVRERLLRMKIGFIVTAAAVWGAVLTGTFIVYPWYRDPAPTSPKSLLLKDPKTADWHEFGMEWKEHIAWITPFLVTAVAFIVVYYGADLIRHPRLRKITMGVYALAFAATAVAGILGAFITKSAPVH